MKTETLLQNLQKSVSEQNKNTQAQLESVTKQHLTSYSELLQSNKQQIEQHLNDQLTLIKLNTESLISATTKKMLLGGITGFLLALLAVLLAINLYMGNNIADKRQELADIQKQIDPTPIQAQALAKVTITQNNDKSLWITAKNPKKSEVGKDTNGNLSIKLE